MKKLHKTITAGAVVLAMSWVSGHAVWAAGAKKKSTLKLQSASFKDGGVIPAKYASCGGQDVSPELSWKGAPPKTKCFALVVEDPDAPMMVFTHWVIFNIPAKPANPGGNTYELLEGFPRDDKTPEGILQGVNDFKKIGYDGPCPPNGLHRYYFKLYALDGPVALSAGVSKDRLLKAIQKHTLAWTQIMGLYGK